jgi:hypothetical protein
MPDTCVAYGCSNKQSKGITLFKFPKDPSLKEKWQEKKQTFHALKPDNQIKSFFLHLQILQK